ncbi:hydantoinase/oxoprolinase family protein [Halorussus halophilus]|uniref:hydantoinase/oxoprolinase family protein n=1 Tax=Halorussus halophilus TaxID=2650975 RepID=UPI0013017525|nr:hydantoinase/oxoprolinase family protein [Halorussus halophilus]
MIPPRIGVDVGGTFTDVTLLTTDGELVTAKVPSTADQSDGVLDGIEKACEAGDVDPADLREFAHAMTVSTNALLERDGAKTALVTTEGFRDVLEIGRQTRPDLYDLDAEKPDPLVPRRHRYELAERATAEGVRAPVDDSEIDALAEQLHAADVESVAVVFLHAYATPENERAVAERLRAELDVPVSASHEVLAEFREYERTATTAVDAYVTPTIDSYLGRLEQRALDAGVPAPRIMQSNGGITDAKTARSNAATTALSGPAAGVVGANQIAGETTNEQNLDGLVTLDMGGTSSDVSLVREGAAEQTTDTTIADVPIRLPMVDIHTIGSGGGSIARIDAGGALRVGPESAGSEPGPACYGKGGTDPTVTDANVVLGYIGDTAALGGELTIDDEAARDALESLADEADLDSAREVAAGVYDVANANMSRAVRSVTVERGYDPREFGLVAFGGAGPMHAAPVADALGIDTVVVPLAGGVLSAYGLLAADERYDEVRTHLVSLGEAEGGEIESIFADLEASVLDNFADGAGDAADADEADASVEYAADLRYEGQSFELSVPVDTGGDGLELSRLRERFHAAHEQAYGYSVEEAIELVNLRVTASIENETTNPTYEPEGDSYRASRTAFFGGDAFETDIYRRRGLEVGAEIDGPAVVEQAESTTVIPPDWDGVVQGDGTLVLTRGEKR